MSRADDASAAEFDRLPEWVDADRSVTGSREVSSALLAAASAEPLGSVITLEVVASYARVISEAWELRDSPYAADAAKAVCDWFDELPARVEALREAIAAERRRALFAAIDEACAEQAA
jgi:hypothetical protein